MGWAPNSFAKRVSLYTHIDMFTNAVDMNFAGPAEMLSKERLSMVDTEVSIRLAVI